MPDADPWRREPLEGQIRLTASFPGANMAALHAVARARLSSLRQRLLAPDAELRALADAIARRDAPARDWAERETLLAAGQQELRAIQAAWNQLDETGRLDGVPSQAGIIRWGELAAARLERLVPAVLALEEAHPALRDAVEADRAARIAALTRRVIAHAGVSWHRPPAPSDETMPPPLRAACLVARNGHGHAVTLHWRHDAANGMEWLRWQSQAGRRHEDGSIAGRDAVLAALRPLALAA